jgi:hypothetical protein
MVRANFDLTAAHSVALLTGGWVLVAAGILTLPLPAPVSMPAITLGGLLLTRHSRLFRHGVAALRRRFPESSAALTRRGRRLPRPLRYIALRTDPRRVGGRRSFQLSRSEIHLSTVGGA